MKIWGGNNIVIAIALPNTITEEPSFYTLPTGIRIYHSIAFIDGKRLQNVVRNFTNFLTIHIV